MLVRTPKSINDEDNRDVFQEIFFDSGGVAYWTYDSGTLKNKCWARFADVGIGNNDVDYWVECMKNKVTDLMDSYFYKFRAWDKYSTSIDPLHVDDIDMSSFKTESHSTHRTYDPPEVTTSGDVAANYLADQGQTDFEQKDSSGLDTVTVTEYIDAIHNPYDDFCRELSKLFYWGL